MWGPRPSAEEQDSAKIERLYVSLSLTVPPEKDGRTVLGNDCAGVTVSPLPVHPYSHFRFSSHLATTYNPLILLHAPPSFPSSVKMFVTAQSNYHNLKNKLDSYYFIIKIITL